MSTLTSISFHCVDRHPRRIGQDRNQNSFEKQNNAQIQLLAQEKKPTMAALNSLMATPCTGKCKGKGKGTGGTSGCLSGHPAAQFSTPRCMLPQRRAPWPEWRMGLSCPIIGPNGKTTWSFPHTLMKKEDFEKARRPQAASPAAGNSAAPLWKPKGKGKGHILLQAKERAMERTKVNIKTN